MVVTSEVLGAWRTGLARYSRNNVPKHLCTSHICNLSDNKRRLQTTTSSIQSSVTRQVYAPPAYSHMLTDLGTYVVSAHLAALFICSIKHKRQPLNICSVFLPLHAIAMERYWHRMASVCLSVRPSVRLCVTLMDCDHIR